MRSWDVFCKVVDNYGDAAVCWRLAQQLADAHGAPVRLWIDGIEVLHELCPDIVAEKSRQIVAGVEVCHWTQRSDFGAPADIVVDGFGGGLPEPYVEAMAQRSPPALWITLEYLSAEPWVAEHHGLPSRHPRLALERYFFFPGFSPGTGGLPREAGLEARRDEFQRDPVLQARFWKDLGFTPPNGEAIVTSVFGYSNPAVAEILDAWSSGSGPVVAAVPRGAARAPMGAYFGVIDPEDGTVLRRGSLEVRLLPFLPQQRYDELLWACDWNFVRGEDSFVRAQLAARPLVWHIYPQEARAHWVKLDAFLDAYCAELESAPGAALRALWHAWNDGGGNGTSGAPRVRAAWQAAEPHHERLRRHAQAWAARLAAVGDLAGNLAQFCEKRLK
ncbi:MAG: elongation factor P maturation arginine rhamnosyltransferase EarP [Betaproteobacteria bacterium]|nr:elongation factor P maturation arginine rhamnosyltransferase EarP [Betaproteobacteria bacterium]